MKTKKIMTIFAVTLLLSSSFFAKNADASGCRCIVPSSALILGDIIEDCPPQQCSGKQCTVKETDLIITGYDQSGEPIFHTLESITKYPCAPDYPGPQETPPIPSGL